MVTATNVDLAECVQNYNWPGNVRELENVLAKAVALCSGNIIIRDLISQICEPQTKEGLETIAERPMSEWSLAEMDKMHIQRVLESTDWHKGYACGIPDISRRMIKQFNLEIPADVLQDDFDTNDNNGLKERQ